MKITVLALLIVTAFFANLGAAVTAADLEASNVSAPGNRLIGLLPASDGVAAIDARRALGDALPRVLAANPPMLAKIMAHISEMEARTGIDFKKFDQVAVGVAVKKISARQTDFQPVAIASGDVNAGALVSVAKLASGGKYREEKVGARTLYVFAAKDALKKGPVVPNAKAAGMVDKVVNGLTKEIAITALDRGTLVMGSPDRVRETIAATSKVSADVLALLSGREAAIVSFAMRTPAGTFDGVLPMDNDEIGRSIGSIEYIAGSFDVTAAGAATSMIARTKTADQAASLRDTLEGLQMIGGAFMSNSKRPDQQVYGRLIKAAKFDSRGTDLTLDLLVSQSDIDAIVGKMK